MFVYLGVFVVGSFDVVCILLYLKLVIEKVVNIGIVFELNYEVLNSLKLDLIIVGSCVVKKVDELKNIVMMIDVIILKEVNIL